MEGNLEQSIKYLDSLDISEYLESDRAVADIMYDLDAIFGGDFERLTGNERLFGGWTEDNFADYIRNAYGRRCYEKSILFVK